MRQRVKLNWRVPDRIQERFKEFAYDMYTPDACQCGECDKDEVCKEKSPLSGYYGRAVEIAMAEYVDEERQELESMVDDYLKLAGLHRGDIDGQDAYGVKSKCHVRVDPHLKEEIKNKKSEDETCGEAVARAMEEFMAGGFVSRLKEKLERVDPDIRANLSMENDIDSDMGRIEKTRAKICRRLGSEFTDEELEVAIRTQVKSDKTVSKYQERVTEHLEKEPHPENPDLWIPKQKAEEIAPDGAPRVCRIPAEHLDKQEKLRRIKIEVGRRAVSERFQSAQLSTADIHVEILGMDGTERHVLNYMGEIDNEQGFKRHKKDGTTYLRVNFEKVADDLSDTILAYVNVGEEDSESTNDVDADDQDAASEDDVETGVEAADKPDGLGEPHTDWFDDAVDAVDDLPDTALEANGETIARNKIARAKFPDEVTDDEVSSTALDTVTDEDVQRVLDTVTDASVDEGDANTDVQQACDNLNNAVPADD